MYTLIFIGAFENKEKKNSQAPNLKTHHTSQGDVIVQK